MEIGPRFVMTPIRIFEGAFGGATVFANPGAYSVTIATRHIHRVNILLIVLTEFVPPAVVRSATRREKGDRYRERKLAQAERAGRKEMRVLPEDELAVSKVFA